MRLLFINRYFYPDISATSQLLTELAEDLAAKGETVTVITGNSSYLGDETRFEAEERHKGIRILRVGCTRFGRSRVLGRLADYVSFWICAFRAAVRLKEQDCLVVLSDPPLLSVFAAVIRFMNPVKTVCWLQDTFPDIAIRARVLDDWVSGPVLKCIAKWSLRRMDRVIAIGRCMERRLLSEGIPSQSIIQISNWADGQLIQPLPHRGNTFRRQHGLQDRFVVMYSGNHGVVHDCETLIQLMRETRDVPDLCFCFVGEGVWKPHLVDIACAEGWKHSVFLPYESKEGLKASLSAADLHLVSLRRDMEGLSIPSKLYGILAAGRPVLFIGHPSSEASLVIKEAGCGFCVEPGDTRGAVQAVLTGYRNPALLEEQGAAARRYFDRQCDRPLAAARFQEALERLCTESEVRSPAWKTISPISRNQ